MLVDYVCEECEKRYKKVHRGRLQVRPKATEEGEERHECWSKLYVWYDYEINKNKLNVIRRISLRRDSTHLQESLGLLIIMIWLFNLTSEIVTYYESH